MAQVNRASIAANLNTTTAWVGGAVPTATDIAAWGTPLVTTGASQALGGAVSWQGILLQSAQTTNISITTTAAAMTLGASGLDLSASGANLTIASPVTVTLGASQPWSVASGRTLTISSVISGSAKNVTISGAGTTTLSANNSTGWTGSTLTVSGGVVVASDSRAVGAASNQIIVSAGGAIRFTGTGAAPPPTSFTVAGSGATGLQWGSIFFADVGAFGSGKTITLTGASPVIGVQAGAQAGAIAGSPTGDVTFNMFGTNTTNATFSSPLSNFTVANGNRIILQGVNPTTGATTIADFALASTDDYGLGNANNKVSVKSSVRLITNAITTLYRDYFFEGQVGSGTPSGTATYSIGTSADALFRGTITATAGNWVAVYNAGQTAQRTLQLGSILGGKLDGTWNLRSFSSPQTIYLDPGLDISTWTGALYAYRVSYGVAPTGAATYESGATIDNIGLSTPTLAHSSYTLLGNLTFTGTSSMSLGGGNVTAVTSPTITVSANTLTIPGNISGPNTLAKNGAGTLILSGSNTIATSVTLSSGALVLNSAGSAGGTGTAFIFVTGTELDSTTGAVLNQTGNVNTGTLAGSWTWKGTSSLTFSGATVSAGDDRTITFASGGQNGTLKFAGAIATSAVGIVWDFGGSTAGAKQRVTLGGANASLANTTAANQHAVTTGYFRIENANGLGNAATTTAWWVGATNLGVQTVGAKAALELAGVTTPEAKNVKLYNTGPNDDGALIGASGTSVFSGNIEVPNVAGTRIGVKSGATLTLLGSGSYQNLNPANANTPLSFTAESSGTLNVNRILGGGGTSNVGTVAVTGGTGTVVFSRANLHTGAMTCSSGTTKLTDANAAGAGAGNSVTVSPGATMEVTAKVVFPATLTLGSTGSAATFKVSV